MTLRRQYGRPSLLLGINGFWGTLHADPGQLRLARGEKTVALISDIEDIGTDLADNGYGTWLPSLIVTAFGAKLPFMPFERRGLFPHTVTDPSAIAAEARRIVFGEPGRRG